VVAAAFRKAGSLGEGSMAFAVDSPCLIMLQRKPGLLRVAVSEPTGRARTPITVQVGSSASALTLAAGTEVVPSTAGLGLRIVPPVQAGATLVSEFTVDR
jgi:hypothetical protein